MSAQETAMQPGSAPQKPITIAPMSIQQEDNIIHTRITNDEKALRRVARKFHNYTSVAYDTTVPPSPGVTTSVEDARDAFLIELASFHLSLKKSLMVCEAEARQVEEYQREKERIENERTRLKDQIEELKTSLEQAQIHRKRKMEYDVIAEKINVLPSREELEQSIRSLENDMAAIRAEHENQDRILQAQQDALGTVITSIQDLRTLGKGDVDFPEESGMTPASEVQVGEEADDVEMRSPTQEEVGEIREEKGDEDKGRESDEDVPLAKKRPNPSARSFMPHASSSPRLSTPQLQSSDAPTPMSAPPDNSREEGEDDDIEMGELAEEPKDKEKSVKKKIREDLEEGEASDESSELSELPSDTEYP